MRNVIFAAMCALMLGGCVGGPTKDFYNPEITGARFTGPVVMKQVKDVEAETSGLTAAGYVVIGRTKYNGGNPKAIELQKQAERVHANYVVYSCEFIPAAPGSWSFNLSNFGAQGGSGNGTYDVNIVFLGK